MFSLSSLALKLTTITASVSESILLSIALVIVVAALIAFIARMFKQEIVIAYIVAGILIGPLCLGLIKDTTLIKQLAEIGVAFLLFVAGLEMNAKKLKDSFASSLITSIIQIIFITSIAFLILHSLGLGKDEATLLAILLAFSSTVLVTKIFSDRDELNTLHARLAIGILLIQDIVAVIALATLSKTFTPYFVIFTFLKLTLLCLIAGFIYLGFFKRMAKKAATSTELLFIISIAFLFLLVFLSLVLKISIAIGAFIAGITLANSPYKIEISAKTKALRDFFSVMFFVSVGMLFSSITKSSLILFIPAFIVVVFVKSLLTALCLKLQGYTAKTSLQTGLSLAQVSEFSLIIGVIALTNGLITSDSFDMLVLLTIVSMASTPYIIKLEKVFRRNFKKIKIKKKREDEEKKVKGKKTVILFGCHRMGSVIIKQFEKVKHKLLVVDFNPDVIKSLRKKGVSCIYGDASNLELLNKLAAEHEQNLRVIISTLPKLEDNLLILKYFKKIKPKVFVVLTAEQISEALQLYKAGADYVMIPRTISAQQIVEMIKSLTKKDFAKLKKKHINYLKDLEHFFKS